MRYDPCVASPEINAAEVAGVVPLHSHKKAEPLPLSAMLSCMSTCRHPTPGFPLTL